MTAISSSRSRLLRAASACAFAAVDVDADCVGTIALSSAFGLIEKGKIRGENDNNNEAKTNIGGGGGSADELEWHVGRRRVSLLELGRS